MIFTPSPRHRSVPRRTRPDEGDMIFTPSARHQSVPGIQDQTGTVQRLGGTRTVQNNTKTKNTLSDRSYLPLRELFAEDGHSIPGQCTKMLDSGRVQPHGGEPHRHWQNKSNAEAAISMRILLSIRKWATESLEASRTLRAPSRLKHTFKGQNRKLRITASILL